MTSVVVRDDPAYPEGGHALVVFEGIATVPTDARLQLEPSDEASTYRGPRDLDASVRTTDEGLELAIEVDKALLEHLPPHTAVVLSVPGTNLSGETLWPPLTPPRAVPRRRPIADVGRRVVATPVPRVLGHAPSGLTIRQASDLGAEPLGEAEARMPVADPVSPKTLKEPVHADKNGMLGAPPDSPQRRLGEPSLPEPEVHQGTHVPVIAPPPERDRRSVNGRVSALLALAGFLAGVLATAGFVGLKPEWFVTPVKITVVRDSAQYKMPSPYEILMALPARSPRGEQAAPASVSELTQRGVEAWKRGDHADAKFWFSWAVRTQLGDKASRTASALSNFADVIADGPPDAARFGAARLLWEMGAVAQDCDAMRNIVESFSLEAVNEQDQETTKQWKRRAAACHD